METDSLTQFEGQHFFIFIFFWEKIKTTLIFKLLVELDL
jgi:hypothetical protein